MCVMDMFFSNFYWFCRTNINWFLKSKIRFESCLKQKMIWPLSFWGLISQTLYIRKLTKTIWAFGKFLLYMKNVAQKFWSLYGLNHFFYSKYLYHFVMVFCVCWCVFGIMIFWPLRFKSEKKNCRFTTKMVSKICYGTYVKSYDKCIFLNTILNLGRLRNNVRVWRKIPAFTCEKS